MPEIEFGLDTFGNLTLTDAGEQVSAAQTIRDIVDQGVRADEVGVDFFAVGEHHRADFAISIPEMVLAGIATRTSRVRLGAAVSVLSSDDPVRLFQRCSTLDALSGGRAEVVVGRGSFVESFPLFGYDLNDYEALFDEKLELLAEVMKEKPVTWSGQHRAALHNQIIYPPTENGMPVWVGVGGTPQSAVRAARHGMGMMLAIIGGGPERFLPLIDLYRRAAEQFGTEAKPIAMHSLGHVGASDQEAWEAAFPGIQAMRISMSGGRATYGWEHFMQEVSPEGGLYIGSPERVAQKIARTIGVLGVKRFMLKYSTGPLGHEHLMGSISLYGTEVIPRVRQLLAGAGRS